MKGIKSSIPILFSVSLFLALVQPVDALTQDKGKIGKAPEPVKKKVLDSYGKLPLYFIENQGQMNGQVFYYTRLSNQSIYFTKDRIVFDLMRGQKAERERLVFSLSLEGAQKGVSITGTDKQENKVNYFTGGDRSKWRTNIPTYKGVMYSDIYESIDLKVYGNGKALEYDFIVKPGADPDKIRLLYNGIEGLKVSEKGELIIRTAFGDLKESRPHAYQVIDGKKVEIDARFRVQDPKSLPCETRSLLHWGEIRNPKWEYGFQLASYNPSHPLVIDPTLLYSTYLGGDDFDKGYGIAVDGNGNAYVTGSTGSSDFPTHNPYQGSYGGDMDDAFVTKFNSDGTALVYSTYLGGEDFDRGYAIAVDGSGNAYVTGHTQSYNFPTLNPYKGGGGGGSNWDVFVTKISASGTALSYSTYLGGIGYDYGYGITVDSGGNAYVTGHTGSHDFPTLNPYQGSYAGGSGWDIFVTKFNDSGTTLLYSTYLGGTGYDYCRGIAVDSAGNAYVTGYTDSGDFPTLNPYQGSKDSGWDVFVTKFNAAGTTLSYSTYLGGNDDDHGCGIAVDSAGNAYITGYTPSNDFPTYNPYQGSYAGSNMIGFVTKFNASGTALSYSTYLGGTSYEECWGIAVDGGGNAYITGYTSSSDFPTHNPYQGYIGGLNDAFVTKFNSNGSELIYSTYLGGSDFDQGYAIAVDGNGNAYVAGETKSIDFPTQNPYQGSYGGGSCDAFVAKTSSDGNGADRMAMPWLLLLLGD